MMHLCMLRLFLAVSSQIIVQLAMSVHSGRQTYIIEEKIKSSSNLFCGRHGDFAL